MRSRSGFSFVNWLRARYPYDARARSKKVQQKAVDWFAGRSCLKILDLGSGIGANTQYFAPIFPSLQEWTLLEIEPGLIQATFYELQKWADQKGWKALTTPKQLTIETSHGEITVLLKRKSLFKLMSADEIRPYDLVTANALFDLIPPDKFMEFASVLFRAARPLLSTLNYHSMHFDPKDGADEYYLSLYESHMMRNNEVGSSMGPQCVHQMVKMLNQVGFRVYSDVSIWKIPPDDKIMMDFMFGFLKQALSEMIVDSQEFQKFNLWKRKKLSLLEKNRLQLTVKHWDFFAQSEFNIC